MAYKYIIYTENIISYLTFPSCCIISENELKQIKQLISNLRSKFRQKNNELEI